MTRHNETLCVGDSFNQKLLSPRRDLLVLAVNPWPYQRHIPGLGRNAPPTKHCEDTFFALLDDAAPLPTPVYRAVQFVEPDSTRCLAQAWPARCFERAVLVKTIRQGQVPGCRQRFDSKIVIARKDVRQNLLAAKEKSLLVEFAPCRTVGSY